MLEKKETGLVSTLMGENRDRKGCEKGAKMEMGREETYGEITRMARERYQKRYGEHGEDPRTLGWGCREDQTERFSVMCDNYDFEGKTVMDVGCGFADFMLEAVR